MLYTANPSTFFLFGVDGDWACGALSFTTTEAQLLCYANVNVVIIQTVVWML